MGGMGCLGLVILMGVDWGKPLFGAVGMYVGD